jgi:uncharacterized protein
VTQVNVQPFEIDIPTRFGTTVRADVYMPSGVKGKVPTLLAASPYQKSLRKLPVNFVFPFIEYGPIQLYLDEGYAYVILDLPGSGNSEGIWDPWSLQEGQAVYDAIEHMAKLDWCNGNIGMIGQSYYAMTQWNVGRTQPPHLKTMVVFDGAADPYRDVLYHGGIPVQGFLGSWLIGSVMLQHAGEGHDPRGGNRHEVLPDVISHQFDDEWHRRRSAYWELDKIKIPVFSIGVWGKSTLHLRGNVLGYEGVRGPKKLLIESPDTFLGAQALFATEKFHRDEMLPWYDHFLKGSNNDVMAKPDVRFFINGAAKYDSAATWPPANTSPTPFYLSSTKSGAVDSLNDGSLSELAPHVKAAATSWSYPDPKWMAGVTTFKNGIPDHVARVNTFTTSVFTEDIEFTGQGLLALHLMSDQTDADVFVRVSVMPAAGAPGHARKVTQGWLRASHRAEDAQRTRELRPFHPHDKAEPLVPGQTYEMRVELMPYSFLVHSGERLRLEISNCDSTMIDQPMTHWYGQKVGTDTYHHDAERPSRLILSRRASS